MHNFIDLVNTSKIIEGLIFGNELGLLHVLSSNFTFVDQNLGNCVFKLIITFCLCFILCELFLSCGAYTRFIAQV